MKVKTAQIPQVPLDKLYAMPEGGRPSRRHARQREDAMSNTMQLTEADWTLHIGVKGSKVVNLDWSEQLSKEPRMTVHQRDRYIFRVLQAAIVMLYRAKLPIYYEKRTDMPTLDEVADYWAAPRSRLKRRDVVRKTHSLTKERKS